MRIDIGTDPDSKAHGVAIYKDKVLVDLKNLQLMQLLELAKKLHDEGAKVKFHIEDVDANKANWHNKKGTKASFGRSSSDMGKCRQSAIELIRALEYYGFEYQLYPISNAWKKAGGPKKQFELTTKWTKRSNEDTRSAAFFGYLGLR